MTRSHSIMECQQAMGIRSSIVKYNVDSVIASHFSTTHHFPWRISYRLDWFSFSTYFFFADTHFVYTTILQLVSRNMYGRKFSIDTQWLSSKGARILIVIFSDWKGGFYNAIFSQNVCSKFLSVFYCQRTGTPLANHTQMNDVEQVIHVTYVSFHLINYTHKIRRFIRMECSKRFRLR